MITSDGIEVKGYKTHFIDRVIGTYQDKDGYAREGVSVDEVIYVLQNSKTQKDKIKNGLKSRTYFGVDSTVTINPDTGILIQTNHI